jgi:hypothetical protein
VRKDGGHSDLDFAGFVFELALDVVFELVMGLLEVL